MVAALPVSNTDDIRNMFDGIRKGHSMSKQSKTGCNLHCRCGSPERRSTSVYHRLMYIAHDSFMSNVSACFQPLAYQSGMYMSSRMSSHFVSNVV